MKKLKFRHPTNRVLIFILVMIIALQSALLWFVFYEIQAETDTINCANHYQGTALCLSSQFPLIESFLSSVRSIYISQGVVDMNGSRVSFPDLKIYLPFNNLSRSIRYISGKPTNQYQIASIITSSILDQTIFNWNQTACLQYLAGISLGKPSADFQDSVSAGSVKLNDGRVLYLYRHNRSNCRNVWGPDTQNQVIDLLKQAQSY